MSAKNQYGPQLGQALMEAGMTQLSFSFDAHVSPESVSAYKNGRAIAPPDVKSKSVLVTDNPYLAIAAAHESTAGTSPVILDGDNVELNRHTVVVKTVEEVEELLAAIKQVRPILIKPPKSLTAAERQQVEHLIQETLDVVTSTTNMAAVICREMRFSWVYQWGLHKSKLVKEGFMKMMKGAGRHE
ncbi:XRE family transcriptional regulator [Brevibacillus sp. 1238]|uniref:XRE family transcriptional regulator n=1 Tax=Brevibacillus sp. 1238 TaxID=2940565 RepID=UPI0024742176|nr:XRE family transcriptional regulator [Brevibacillus sp. 1238]MDH6351884.1 NTP pyrophosphatase (non-canonical NTP hydrolase) [Brevibacillus sp. 1238]